jgi:hypothetical protein
VLDVLQIRLTQVADLDSLGHVVADERPRRLREENLAAVPRRADARRPNDVHAEVPLLADGRLPGMEPHADLHLGALWPLVLGQRALAGDGTRDGVTRPCEREEERVALGVDLPTSRLAQLLPQNPPVVPVHVLIPIAELLEEASRPLDVGEQKCDGAPGELAHAARLDR